MKKTPEILDTMFGGTFREVRPNCWMREMPELLIVTRYRGFGPGVFKMRLRDVSKDAGKERDITEAFETEMKRNDSQ